VEASLLLLHLALLAGVEFVGGPLLDRVYDFGLHLGFLPVVILTAGRWAPWVLMLPGLALPIVGKTVQELVYEKPLLPAPAGWLVYGLIPLGATLIAATVLGRRAKRGATADAALAPALALATLLYWGLNFGFFRHPWPWMAWTPRTPNALVFTVCAVVLTTFALRSRKPSEITA
jgi:hypothetical protein